MFRLRHISGIKASLTGLALCMTLAPPLAAQGVANSCNASGSAVALVGPSRTFHTISAAVSAAQATGSTITTICVDAGDYVNDFPATITTPLKLYGVGGLAHMRSTLADLPNRKAILLTRADVTIDGFEFSGAKVGDRNGAGIRYEGGKLTVVDSLFHDNENGILGASAGGLPGPIGSHLVTVLNSEFFRNGFVSGGVGDGQTHGIYLAGGHSLTVRKSFFSEQYEGHHIKSRAGTTVVEDSTFEDGLGPAGLVASYSIDLPNGGSAVVRRSTFYQRNGQGLPRGVNGTVINYGGEVPTVPAGSALTVEQSTFINYKSGPATAVKNRTTTAPTTMTGNTTVNVSTLTSGGVSQTLSGNRELPFSAFPPKLIRPGALVVLRAPANGQGARLLQFDRHTGALLDSLSLPGGITGLTDIDLSIGNRVSARRHGVGVLDLGIGTSTLFNGVQAIEDFGTFGDEVIALPYDNNTLLVLDDAGVVSRTILLSTSSPLRARGLDSNGESIFVASGPKGRIYVFNADGSLSRTFSTGLSTTTIRSLDYDPTDDSLWLLTRSQTATVYHFDLFGTLLGQVGLAEPLLEGLWVSPELTALHFAALPTAAGSADEDELLTGLRATSVNAPPSLMLFLSSLALLGLLASQRRGAAR